MCTEKQLEWALKLAKWADKELDVESVRGMTGEQLDALFEGLKVALDQKKAAKKAQPQIAKGEFNPYRFGMCCKIVADDFRAEKRETSTEDYKICVKMMYNTISDIEGELSSSSSLSYEQEDQLLESGRERDSSARH